MSPPVKTDLDLSNERFGLFSSMFLWIYGLCSPFAGYIADRVGRKPIILASLGIWSAATLFTGFVKSFEEMLIDAGVLGRERSILHARGGSVDCRSPRGPHASPPTGLHLSGVYVGSVLGGLGGWLAEQQGWRFGFIAFGSLGVVYALFLIIVLRVGDSRPTPSTPPLQEEEKAARGVAVSSSFLLSCREGGRGVGFSRLFLTLFSSRGFVLMLAMNALNGAAYWPVRNWLPSFFNSEVGVSLTWSGLCGTASFNMAAFLGMLLGSSISDALAVKNPRVAARSCRRLGSASRLRVYWCWDLV